MEQALITFEIEEGEKPIVLKLQKHNGRDIIYYRFGKSTPMRALFLDYCFRIQLVYKDTNFVYNNLRIPETSTPEDLQMLNSGRDNVIHVFSSRHDKLIDMCAKWKLSKSSLADEEHHCIYLTVSEIARDAKHKCYHYYKCSRDMPLYLLMLDYCERRGLRSQDVCYLYKSPCPKEKDVHVLRVFSDGDTKTPNGLQMNDHDVLGAYFHRGTSRARDREGMERPFPSEAGERIITLRVEGYADVSYKISRKMPLKALIIDYCNHVGLVYEKLVFLYNGKILLNEDKTGGDGDGGWRCY